MSRLDPARIRKTFVFRSAYEYSRPLMHMVRMRPLSSQASWVKKSKGGAVGCDGPHLASRIAFVPIRSRGPEPKVAKTTASSSTLCTIDNTKKTH